ncbi:MAG: xylulokinase [Succinatimonas sp.]|nr:xylulokinase [Succinatimonas sp.]
MKYLLGVDLGTSGTKTVLFDEEGNAIASALREYPLIQLKNGWAEQDPEAWYQAAVDTIREVLQKSKISNTKIAGLGISGQMHGLVMLDDEGKVLRNAILWCDGRTEKQCQEITSLVGAQRLIEINANPALTGFTAPKILWVREHEPEIYAKCAHILLPKDYVRFRLTGELLIEISDASGTNLLDMTKREWSDEILDKLSIDKKLLSKLVGSSECAGYISAEAASATGLSQGTVVAGGAGDNAAAAIGTGVCRDGQAFVTLGTSGVIFAHTSHPAIDPLGRVHTFCAAVPGAWTAMSCTLAAGLSLRWERDVLFAAEKKNEESCGRDVYDLMTAQASKIPSGADGLIYLPYLMGERSPVLDPQSRGVFFGLSAMHTKAHMTRAVLEGVTFSQRHNLHVLKEMGVMPKTLMACGGGASSSLWRQMLADVMQVNVKTMVSKEGPALGAAVLAGVASGVFSSVEDGCDRCVRCAKQQSVPDIKEVVRYNRIYSLYQSLYPALRPSFSRLARLREELSGGKSTYPEVSSVEFERYGRVVNTLDNKRIVSLLKKTALPKEGTVYVASEPLLEEQDLLLSVQNTVFGGLPVEMGYCAGYNRTLNCLEFHRSSEINVAEKDMLLMVAPATAIKGDYVDSEEVESFLVKAGTAVQFYETTLHYCPCTADGEEYFRMCCILPRGTNTERPDGVGSDGEDGCLTNNNKWLYAHKDSSEAKSGLTRGVVLGDNITL